MRYVLMSSLACAVGVVLGLSSVPEAYAQFGEKKLAPPIVKKVPQTIRPTISKITATAGGYVIFGKGFGSNKKHIIVMEGNTKLPAQAIRSVTDTRIEVLSKPARAVSVRVRVRTKAQQVQIEMFKAASEAQARLMELEIERGKLLLEAAKLEQELELQDDEQAHETRMKLAELRVKMEEVEARRDIAREQVRAAQAQAAQAQAQVRTLVSNAYMFRPQLSAFPQQKKPAKKAIAVAGQLTQQRIARTAKPVPKLSTAPPVQAAKKLTISKITATAGGYVIFGKGFGSNKKHIIVMEGNTKLPAQAIRSVTDTRIKVLSKPARAASVRVRVRGLVSNAYMFRSRLPALPQQK